jgi:hypothetical protein
MPTTKRRSLVPASHHSITKRFGIWSVLRTDSETNL